VEKVGESRKREDKLGLPAGWKGEKLKV